MHKRMTIYFSGHVQGVGFRYGTQQVAMGYDLAGTVENLPDGRVGLTIEGHEEELKGFLQAIEDSHLGSHVRQKEVIWSELQGGFIGFKIKR